MVVSAGDAGFLLDDVAVVRGDVSVLRDVSCVLPDRGITVVAGPSGAGKTTLLRLLDRLDVPTSGTVSWRGRPLDGLDPCTLRRLVGMVAQRPVPFAGSVADNLRVAEPGLDDEAVATLLDLVGLPAAVADHDATTLSGGEAQRMCVARTLATGPEVILADEPTSSLDLAPRRALEDLARRLADADDGAVGWIWVSHDLDQLERLADVVAVVVDGEVLAVGPLQEVRHHDREVVRNVVGAR